MDIKLSLFDVLLLIGIVQGSVISVLIWLTKGKKQDKLLLSIVLTVFNLLCIKIILLTSSLWQTNLLRYFPLPFDLAIQPLLFLYITSLTAIDFRLNKKQLIHFIPFFISLAYSMFVYVSTLRYFDLAEKDRLANLFLFNEVKEAEDILSVLSGVIYWTFGLMCIIRYRKWLYNNTSNTLYPTYEWLRNVIVLLGAFFLMLGTNITLDYGFDYGFTHFIHWQLLFVYLAVLIYYLGFRGYQIPGMETGSLAIDIQEQRQSLDGTNMPFQLEESVPPFPTDLLVIEMPVKEPKYSSTGQAILEMLAEEKLYLDPEFSLQRLAHKLKMSPVAVSRVINSELKQNFRNMVNERRVEEVKTKLKDPRCSQLSLLGIAYESGFNSEASFYRIFKNVVGVSPKEYLLRQKSQ